MNIYNKLFDKNVYVFTFIFPFVSIDIAALPVPKLPQITDEIENFIIDFLTQTEYNNPIN